LLFTLIGRGKEGQYVIGTAFGGRELGLDSVQLFIDEEIDGKEVPKAEVQSGGGVQELGDAGLVRRVY